MRKLKVFLSIVLVAVFAGTSIAQPYTLDEKVVPYRLELKEDKKVKGATAVAANATIKDEAQYFYVAGCNMFQFIDVYIFSNFGSPNFKADLVRNTWGDVETSASTGSSKNGIINFKLRAEGDFGFKVYPGGELINYTIVVYASPVIQAYMGSAFKKASESEVKGAEESSSASGGSSSGSSNMVLYIVLGVALLVIGFLAAKLMSKNKASIILLVLGLSLPSNICAQGAAEQNLEIEIEEVDLDDIRTRQYEERLRELGGEIFDGAGDAIDEGLDRLGEVGDIIEDDERYRVVRDLYDSYVGLGDCINSVPPPGMPRIPSFCETEECGSCFTAARDAFNQNRYTFERLKTIYSCTKTFTDAALSFGDNVSGVHGVSGLAWQSERRKIEKSIKDLQKTYDNKYRELLQAQKNALMQLNDCESQHGIPDWYDRFGYMYYEFTALNYKRPD
jgi:hypothetical protein